VFDGIPFTYMPEGTFLRGSEFQLDDNRERPVREVSISRPFYLSTFEITQAIWHDVMGLALPDRVDRLTIR
jgi:formylglycine-generating enzyme required for sulfatase activity